MKKTIESSPWGVLQRALIPRCLFHWNGGNSKEVDSGGSNGYTMSCFGLQKLSNRGNSVAVAGGHVCKYTHLVPPR
jgi:hypothetical protein